MVEGKNFWHLMNLGFETQLHHSLPFVNLSKSLNSLSLNLLLFKDEGHRIYPKEQEEGINIMS